ncbi:MAG TPA: pitrilysin family protein [Pseudonocardiaceae bacterium]|nr:pitrilysin family protein [Pseudonocardiaceae bacterium]
MTASRTVPPRPSVAAPAAWSFPSGRRWTAPNGLRVLAFDLPGHQLAAARLIVDLPLDSEPKDGIAALTASLWSQGAGERDANAFAGDLSGLGATYNAGVAGDAIVATLDAPVTGLAEALPLLADSVAAPAFTTDDTARLVRTTLQDLAQARTHGESRASDELYRLTFTRDSRLSRPVLGTIADVESFTANDVQAFHTANVAPDRATLVLAGDLSTVDIEVAIADAFASWTGSRPAPSPQRPQAASPSALIVDRAGAAQTTISLGTPIPDRTHPDWAALQLATYVVGGGMNSRLNSVLREEKGYTYGITASLSPERVGGLFLVRCSVATDVTGPAMADLVRILRTAHTSDITERECARARDHFLRAEPIRYQTCAAVADRAGSLVAAHLPDDYPNRHREAVSALTPAAATEALHTHIDPDRLSLVTVGDAATIQADIEKTWPTRPETIPT